MEFLFFISSGIIIFVFPYFFNAFLRATDEFIVDDDNTIRYSEFTELIYVTINRKY